MKYRTNPVKTAQRKGEAHPLQLYGIATAPARHSISLRLLPSFCRRGTIESAKRADPRQHSGIDYWSTLAQRYYRSMRRWDDALATVDEAMASGELTWVEYEEIDQAEWLRMKGEIPQARALLAKCIESCPAETRVKAFEELALLEAATGNLSAALEQVERAASIYRWEDHHLVLAARLLPP